MTNHIHAILRIEHYNETIKNIQSVLVGGGNQIMKQKHKVFTVVYSHVSGGGLLHVWRWSCPMPVSTSCGYRGDR